MHCRTKSLVLGLNSKAVCIYDFFKPLLQINRDEVSYHSRCTASQLEGFVKSEVYPPAVKCAVLYSSPPDFERPSLESFDMKITGTTKRNVSFPVKVYRANGESRCMYMCIQIM